MRTQTITTASEFKNKSNNRNVFARLIWPVMPLFLLFLLNDARVFRMVAKLMNMIKQSVTKYISALSFVRYLFCALSFTFRNKYFHRPTIVSHCQANQRELLEIISGFVYYTMLHFPFNKLIPFFLFASHLQSNFM